MDHDGDPEIVAGRVILHSDGTERGVGNYGRGCPAATGWLDEGAQSAIADLDLDGTEEVIVGNAIYGPDGNDLWHNSGLNDGAVSIANLDSDPEGEFIAVSWNEITALDTDGTVLWGPLANRSANIFPTAAIGDLENDGDVEIVVAGGDLLWVLNADGTLQWDARVHDMSGASGASLFDFDADGILEVVYIDEIQMIAYNGSDGTVKFQTDEHASPTMYDYPVIADVDADGHAEIVVVHEGFGTGLSVYGDVNNSWAPARGVWNQHAYSISNINDDLSVPVTATPNFTLYNSWHSALPLAPGTEMGLEIEAEILDVCEDDCDQGTLRVAARIRNTGLVEAPTGIQVALYARAGGNDTLLGVESTSDAVASGMTSEAIEFVVDAGDVAGATGLVAVADDDGTGTGVLGECVESNNAWLEEGGWCE